MSKQIQKVRISQLAKDLGVDWKDIKTKCESEGIDQAKTASSTVSIGLAATIREWFGSSGGAVTAVETAAKVEARPADAEGGAAAKKAPKRTTKKAAAAADAAETEAAAEAAAPAPEAPAPVVAAAPVAPVKTVAPVAPAAPAVVEPTAAVVIPDAPGLDLAPRLPTEDVSVVTSPESVAPHAVVDAP